jgi:hypothetical protein
MSSTPLICNFGRNHAWQRVIGSLLLNQALMRGIARRRKQTRGSPLPDMR